MIEYSLKTLQIALILLSRGDATLIENVTEEDYYIRTGVVQSNLKAAKEETEKQYRLINWSLNLELDLCVGKRTCRNRR